MPSPRRRRSKPRSRRSRSPRRRSRARRASPRRSPRARSYRSTKETEEETETKEETKKTCTILLSQTPKFYHDQLEGDIFYSANEYNNRLGWPERGTSMRFPSTLGNTLKALRYFEVLRSATVTTTVGQLESEHTKDAIETQKANFTIESGTASYTIRYMIDDTPMTTTYKWEANEFTQRVFDALHDPTVERLKNIVKSLIDTTEDVNATELSKDLDLPKALLENTRVLMLEKMGANEFAKAVQAQITDREGKTQRELTILSKQTKPVDRLNSFLTSYLQPSGVYSDLVNLYVSTNVKGTFPIKTYTNIHVYFDHEMDDILALLFLIVAVPDGTIITVHYADDWYVGDMMTRIVEPVMREFAAKRTNIKFEMGTAYTTNVNAIKCLEHYGFLRIGISFEVTDDHKKRAKARDGAKKYLKKTKKRTWDQEMQTEHEITSEMMETINKLGLHKGF